MNEPTIHWRVSPQYLGMWLQIWDEDNPPIPFLRRKAAGTKHTHTAREPWRVTEAGRADLEAYRERIIK